MSHDAQAPEREILERIAQALERLAPAPVPLAVEGASRLIWRQATRRLEPAPAFRGVGLDLLLGVEAQRDRLLVNTQAFAAGEPANHALLWGARGTGKSALIKAVAAAVPGITLIELPAPALADAPLLIEAVAATRARVILFLDDLALEPGDTVLRALKPALEGGLADTSGGVLVYATANRRHIVAGARGDPRADPSAADSEQERLSLSDRFGLWLGFHPIDQPTYLSIVEAYARHFALPGSAEERRAQALAWAMERGARSGRTAWQFILEQRALASLQQG